MASDKSYATEQRLNALITALAPVIPADTWHSVSLLNGWSGAAAYRLMPGGNVQIDVVIDSTSATAFKFGSLPAAYQPASTRYIAAGASANAGTASATVTMVQIATNGDISMLEVHAFSTAATFGCSGFYRL